jgi:hypothetical protein
MIAGEYEITQKTSRKPKHFPQSKKSLRLPVDALIVPATRRPTPVPLPEPISAEPLANMFMQGDLFGEPL